MCVCVCMCVKITRFYSQHVFISQPTCSGRHKFREAVKRILSWRLSAAGYPTSEDSLNTRDWFRLTARTLFIASYTHRKNTHGGMYDSKACMYIRLYLYLFIYVFIYNLFTYTYVQRQANKKREPKNQQVW